MQVQHLHCNNARENQAFNRACEQEGLGIDFKYTAPGTPQKLKFTTLSNWVHAMCNGGKFTAYLQSALWAEAANTVTIL